MSLSQRHKIGDQGTNEYILTYSAVLYIVILLPLAADITLGIAGMKFGLGGLSVGEMLRGVIFLGGILFLARGMDRVDWILALGSLTLALLLELSIVTNIKLFELGSELNILLKLFFTPVFAFVIYYAVRADPSLNKSVQNAMVGYGTIISLTVIIPVLLGVAKSTYQERSASTLKGIFSSPNDGALALVVSLAITVALALERRSKWLFAASASIFVALMLWGSRIAVFGSVLVPLAVTIEYVLFMGNSRNIDPTEKAQVQRRRRQIVLAIIAFCLLGTGFAVQKVMSDPYIVLKWRSLLNPTAEEMMAGMGRLYNARAAFTSFEERGLVKNLTGVGVAEFESRIYQIGNPGPERTDTKKRVEIDWIDLIGYYGIPFSLLVHAAYIYILYLLWRIYRKSQQFRFFGYFFALLFFLAHSLIAGHALLRPLPGGAIFPAIGLGLYEIRQQKRIASGAPTTGT